MPFTTASSRVNGHTNVLAATVLQIFKHAYYRMSAV